MSSAREESLTIWKRRLGEFFRIPSLGIALCLGFGVALDIWWSPPYQVLGIFFGASAVAWLITNRFGKPGLGLVYLGMMFLGLGAVRHYSITRAIPLTDLRWFLDDSPQLIRVRGVLIREPRTWTSLGEQDLRSFPPRQNTSALMDLQQILVRESWQKISGSIRILVSEPIPDLHSGDEVEVIGRGKLIAGPTNPGEWDYRGFMAQQGIFGEMKVRGAGAMQLLQSHPFPAWNTLFSRVHDWAAGILTSHLDHHLGSLAEALLLGDSPTMGANEWDKYRNTGVLHVLAISGQHLAILGGTLAWFLRLFRIPSNRVALIVTLFLFAYALLTGARPSAIRAAVMVGCFSLGWILRRPAPAIHEMAMAWILLVIFQPWDLFNPGCVLSFLATACLIWVIPKFAPAPRTPLDQLTYASLPLGKRMMVDLWGAVKAGYALSAVVWVLITPVAAYYTHVVSPIALLIGPILVVLTTIALIAGFLSLALAAVLPIAAQVGCWVIYPALWGCSFLVDLGEKVPFGYFFVADKSLTWVLVGYLIFSAWFLGQPLVSRRAWVLAGACWWLVFLIPWRWAPRDLRVSFLAVGHGGCVVMETPEKKVIVYDAGSLSGPEIARRKIAPFLWSRGIQHIDTLILSHADLDHFNALPALGKIFPIGEVIVNPGFFLKLTPGVKRIHGLVGNSARTRELSRGESLAFGSLTGRALHPPGRDFSGNENARSLVLEWIYKGHRILLTGDLQGTGLEEVIKSPIAPVDLMMAPHHGSPGSLGESFLNWAAPGIMIAIQGENAPQVSPAIRVNSNWFSTVESGALLVDMHQHSIVVEAFVSKSRRVYPGREFRE